VKADTSNGNKSLQNVIGTRALPSDISVTPIVSKITDGHDVKRPIEHQPPSVSCYPVNKEADADSPEVVQEKQSTPMSIEDLVAAKKLKDDQSPSQQNSRAFQIPKGLTITEISSASKSDKVASEVVPADNQVQITPAIYDVQALPVLHIPEVSTGDHYDLLQKFDEANLPSVKKSIAPVKTNGTLGGHPGMPNGLLRMTASLHQKSDFSRPGIGKIVTTKVTPKDLKSQMALNKIGLSMNNGNSFQNVSQQVIFQQKKNSTQLNKQVLQGLIECILKFCY
jgi:hypothetical protein